MYVNFGKHNIPMPKTVLLPVELKAAKQELIKFNQWPVVLKRIFGERGEFVYKASNADEAIKLMKRIWNKGNQRYPILAQEFILSNSYRVTMIDGKIVQTAVKPRHGWKATGCEDMRFNRFKISPKLAKLCHQIAKISGITILGIDFIKKGEEWLMLEVNAEPSFKFYDSEHKLMIKKVLQCLKRKVKD